MEVGNLQDKHNEQINILIKQNNQLKFTILKLLYQSQKYESEEKVFQFKYDVIYFKF
jgi:hypothetical protein